MKILHLLAGLLLARASGAEGPFVDLTFEEACAQAKASDRVVFIDFYTTWCPPCKKLDEVTWKDEKVIAWLEKNTVALKIDAEKQVELAKRFEVKAYPSLVFIKPDGEPRGQIVGYREPAAFISEAADVLAGVKKSDRLREKMSEGAKDPMIAKELASELEREGQYAEALELYLWCWDHGAEPPNQGFSGVRVSFLMNDFGRLIQSYPQAKDALSKRRDATRELLIGTPELASGEHWTLMGAHDLAALNKTLGEPKKTLEVYDILLSRAKANGEQQRPTALDPLSQMFDIVAPQLLKAKRYRDVIAGHGDPDEWFDNKKKQFEQMASFLGEESGLSYMRNKFTADSRLLYQALLSTGEHDAVAARLATNLVAFDASVTTWKALMRTARRAKRKDIQTALRQQAIEVLPEEDHSKLRKVKG